MQFLKENNLTGLLCPYMLYMLHISNIQNEGKFLYNCSCLQMYTMPMKVQRVQ